MKKLFISKNAKRILPPLLFILICAVLTVVLLPSISALGTESGREELLGFIDRMGFLGWVIALLIQILQVVVAFLPGEPVELMLGAVFGPWVGTLVCLFGILIGTAIVFFIVKKMGRPLVEVFVGEKDIQKYVFLKDPKRLELTVFFLFFIPGTPKDVLTYIAPLTPISPLRYFIIATLARIPSVVTSTVLGDSIRDGDYVLAITVFVLTAIISALGIFLERVFVAKKQKTVQNSAAASEETAETPSPQKSDK